MKKHVFVLDTYIVTAFLVLIVLTGILTARKVKTLTDYVAYYKKYNPALIGASLSMVIFGSGTIIGGVEEICNVGLIYALATIGYIINSFITAQYIIPKIDKKFSTMITVSDLFGYFYGKGAEKFSSIIAVLFDVGAAASQLVAAGQLFSYFFNVHYLTGILCTGLIMIIYSSLGGIRTVTILDTIKCLMIVIFIPLLAGIFVFKSGGITNIMHYIPQDYLIAIEHGQFVQYFILFLIFSIPIQMMQPIVVQRILMIDMVNVSQKSYVYLWIYKMCFATCSYGNWPFHCSWAIFGIKQCFI